MREVIFEILEDICEDDLRDNPDINLFDEGLMDSLGVVRLIVEIEERLGIELNVMELEKDTINTPNRIIEYLENRG